MKSNQKSPELYNRIAPLEIQGEDFRKLGYQLVDQISDFLDGLPQRPVTTGETPRELRELLPEDNLPEVGSHPGSLLSETADLLFDHSLFNGHPKFWGYITSSAAPIGALADLLAASINPNVGAYSLSPIASEIESQTIRWIADLIGFPRTCGGVLVSGGNMANFVGFLAARKSKIPYDIHQEGLMGSEQRPIVYVSKETHTWIEKAVELFGLGAKSIRWIDTNDNQQMNVNALEIQIKSDLSDNHLPFLVVGTGGTVSTGAIDPLPEIAAICREYDLWFHVDGAYGAPAAVLPDASIDLLGLNEADSVALDPHKWLYSPLEAGCILVRDPRHQVETFSHNPSYYQFDSDEEDPQTNYYEFGLQNSRGFRALKVWLGIRQVGREGYIKMIGNDIKLSQSLFQAVKENPELQAISNNLSITTFRYVPLDLTETSPEIETYLNKLNQELLVILQQNGDAYISNALINNRYLLRACIVNFRTSLKDIEGLPEIIVKLGREIDQSIRPSALK